MTVKIYECDDGHRWVAWKPSEEGKDNCPVCVGKTKCLSELVEAKSQWSGLITNPDDWVPLSPTGVEYMRGVLLDALEAGENSLTPQHF